MARACPRDSLNVTALCLPARARHRIAGSHLPPSGTTMEFRTSIPKTLGLVCLGIALTACCYFVATHWSGYTMVVSWLGVPFFGLAVVATCVQLFRRAPSIVMSAEGISGPRIGSGAVKWSDIAAVSVGQVRQQKFLCLWLHDQDAYVARLPAARRIAAKANFALGFPALNLSFNGLTPGLQQALEYALMHVPQKADS
jgi:hypothetical protein